ncbi:Branched-chain amino acid transport ATP-binding protein LivG (TC 3.A.1.4.1) [[Actinomadura] parvosata subsp. kistnae]|uniref:ABC transporter ATP-binding protein n=1 Tax=[Actinomadura] parvosata subsp. kistnae TaxID=1909395 RepID=A0A1V0A6W1_9ACTN|nr:ABC transporter ATP-binding protein [Nonomuraea sp. ATCC 55076]AQZ65934.1 ABC transporter ATP-binding protein [Nonomuraea sp. ATCC 55076]SPL97390.1 Branched-chain amino acid transport ATP-binding protein LivG (TC 3.A.1.4.1) [Actinomadura parvosata subsp. kistnae]
MLAVDGVSVAFGGVRALDEVTFEVGRGAVCGVIGPNGAGKTTLFDVVSGLRRPGEGRVLLDGHDVTGMPAVRRARAGVRRTFQRTQVFGRLTVAANVLAALDWHGGGGGLAADLVGWPARRRLERERRERVAEVLELCGLTALRDAYAAALPVGQRRLVELARALADRPRLLLLDEPTSGLDAGQSARLGEVVRALETTVLLVEHDMGFVMDTCDRIVVLDLGKVIATGTPAEVREDPVVRAAYLG